jgi:hypothetical protein
LPHATALRLLNEAAAAEETHVAALASCIGDVALRRVPTLADDLHDLAGIARIEAQLFR